MGSVGGFVGFPFPLYRHWYGSVLRPDMQGDIAKLQAKYKGKKDQLSRQAMAQEQMALYKKHGTNPFASCLPIIAQMPIFFGLYQVLM